MNYLVGVGGVALLQVGFSFAIMGIPITALVNFLLIRAKRTNPGVPYALRLIVVSLLLPAAQLALMILVSVFRL